MEIQECFKTIRIRLLNFGCIIRMIVPFPQYPDGYLESMAAKREPEDNSTEEEGGKKSRKRKNMGNILTFLLSSLLTSHCCRFWNSIVTIAE